MRLSPPFLADVGIGGIVVDSVLKGFFQIRGIYSKISVAVFDGVIVSLTRNPERFSVHDVGHVSRAILVPVLLAVQVGIAFIHIEFAFASGSDFPQSNRSVEAGSRDDVSDTFEDKPVFRQIRSTQSLGPWRSYIR